jgi:8-oxo-dGTP diphosphatase
MAEREKKYCYAYPRPALTVDIAVFNLSGTRQILLIQRKAPPFAGKWALPGGFVDENEPLEAAARRELEEETGLKISDLTQVGAFGDPGRDPRGHTVTVAFLAVVPAGGQQVRAGSDAAVAQWFDLDGLPVLAFDHDRIIATAYDRLRAAGSSVSGISHP